MIAPPFAVTGVSGLLEFSYQSGVSTATGCYPRVWQDPLDMLESRITPEHGRNWLPAMSAITKALYDVNNACTNAPSMTDMQVNDRGCMLRTCGDSEVFERL